MSRILENLFLLVSILLAGGLSWAEAENAATNPPTVGVLIPLSGSYAAIGEDSRQGLEVALEVSQSLGAIKFLFADSKADPNTSVTEFRRLVGGDKASAVYLIRSPVGMAVNPISDTLGVPILGGVGDKKFAASNKFAFQIWPKSDEEGGFLAYTIVKRGFRKIAIVTTQDDWTNSVTQGFREELQKSHGSTVFDQELLPTESDFRTIVLRLKGKNPDVVVANLGLAQIGPFLRQAREQNVAVPIYSNFWVAKKDVVQSVGAAMLEGVKFVEMDTNLPTLRRLLEERFHSAPSGATLSAYIATLLMTQAVAEVRSIKSTEEFYAALLKQTEVRTPDGPFRIQDRCIKFPLVEKVMRNGRAETVDGHSATAFINPRPACPAADGTLTCVTAWSGKVVRNG